MSMWMNSVCRCTLPPCPPFLPLPPSFCLHFRDGGKCAVLNFKNVELLQPTLNVFASVDS